MHDDLTGPEPGIVTIDDFVEQLGRLRVRAGSPSYAEIATRIARRREVRGDPAERARVARSTVYDAFRPGRRRLDVRLLTEILGALGLDEASVDLWVEAAQRAAAHPQPSPVTPRNTVPDPDPDPDPGGAVAPQDEVAVSQPPPSVDDEAATPSSSSCLPLERAARGVALLLFACVAANLIGRVLVDTLALPLFLDMTGTAVAAIALGPWWGVLVGVVTNLVGAFISGVVSLPFVLVNVTGALVWGYGVHRYRMSRSLPAFFSLNLIAALACSLVATPIILLYTGVITHSSQDTAEHVAQILHAVVVGTFLGNLFLSTFDKLLSGFIALVVLEARGQSPIALTLAAGQGDPGPDPRPGPRPGG